VRETESCQEYPMTKLMVVKVTIDNARSGWKLRKKESGMKATKQTMARPYGFSCAISQSAKPPIQPKRTPNIRQNRPEAVSPKC
jgi:hypothetical protein